MPVSTERSPTTGLSRPGSAWRTVLFNCDCHTFQEVATQLAQAIHCDFQRGLAIANVVHLTGSATVFTGTRDRCEEVANVLRRVGLRVSVTS